MSSEANSVPRIAVSTGDPAGIGPEVTLKALSDPQVLPVGNWVVVGDAAVLRQAESQTGLALDKLANVTLLDPKRVDATAPTQGKLSAAAGRAALLNVRTATELCLNGKADAMVTAPVNKEGVTLSGEKFTGHTEYIAALCGARDSRMLLVNDRLRVVHVSTHIPLRRACEVDSDRIQRTIELGNQAVRWLGIEHPRVAVCALNPHAGEGGLFGDEDTEIILHAVNTAQLLGIQCSGPIPADTLFLRAVRGEFDLVVAMYHDQGHIPMKLLDFEGTVNVSLGLPIVRTSVDHGTAFDIAGKNQANPSSMKAALKLAAKMALERRREAS